MAGSWFFDENFNGVSEEFFDKVIESLDFPLEDVDVNAGAEDWNAKFQCLEPPSMDILTSLPSETSKRHRSFYSPYNRTSQLKQSADTTSSSSAPLSDESSDVKYKFSFKTSSPVSILESSSSHSVENSRGFETKPQIAVKRARSKRTRPPRFNKQFTLPFVSPASSASEKMYSRAVSESDSDSLTEKRSKTVKRKQKKKNLLHLSGVEMRKPSTEESGETKKCIHCEVTSTPQWREGPMGPKTLCNACGVRYRSGRLFPEYRPAASPTFIPLVHSNSHKKVIEMRNQMAPRANVSSLSSPQLGNSVR